MHILLYRANIDGVNIYTFDPKMIWQSIIFFSSTWYNAKKVNKVFVIHLQTFAIGIILQSFRNLEFGKF